MFKKSSFYIQRTSQVAITVLVMLLFLSACGGSSSNSSSENDNIETNNTETNNPIGVSPSPEETPLLPQINIDQRIFADPNELLPITATVEASDEDVGITNVLWQQVSGPLVEILNPALLNTQAFTPDVSEETQVLFRLTALDSEGRINTATTTIVIQPNRQIGTVIGSIVYNSDSEAVLTLRLTQPSNEDLLIEYTSQDGTAISGIDYEETLGSETLSAGAVEFDIRVPLLNNDNNVDTKTFFLLFNIPTTQGNAISTIEGTVLIRNEDELNLDPPELTNLPNQIIEVSSEITPLAFPNSGGDEVSLCRAIPSLPDGLFVRISEAAASCEIFGQPSAEVDLTDYLIVASNTQGISAATVNLAVTDRVNIEIPSLATIAFQTFTVDTEILPLLFINNGGRIERCESTPPLPAGINISAFYNAESDIDSCILSGIPTSTAENIQYEIRGINRSGESLIDFSFEITGPEIIVEPPSLGTVSSQVFTIGGEIVFIDFQNAGGRMTECFSSPALPGGLRLTIVNTSEAANDCRLSGTPTEASPEQDYEINALNISGSSTSIITIEAVALPPEGPLEGPPVFASVNTLSFNVGLPIPSLSLSGSEATTDSCSVFPVLPVGVSVSPECVISGTPLEQSPTLNYVFTAINASGQSTTTIEITVEETAPGAPILLEGPDLIFEVGVEVTSFVFSNIGADTISCSSDRNLPLGMELVSSQGTCIISGTPIVERSRRNFVITGSNENGDSTATLSIAIFNPPVLIDDLEARIYALGEPITSFLTLDAGSLDRIISCSTSPALPTGLRYRINDNNTDCRVAGTPETAAPKTEYTLIATNSVGSGETTIQITVEVLSAETLEIPYTDTSALEVSLSVLSGEAIIDWGDGSDEAIISNGSVERIFPEARSGVATITITNGFDTVTDFNVANNTGNGFSFEASDFEGFINLERFSINQGTINGSLSSFSGLSKLNTFFAALFTNETDVVFEGNIRDFPASLTNFALNVPNSIFKGDLSELKNNQMRSFAVLSNTSITGQLTDISLFDTLNTFKIASGDNSITGSLSELPPTLSIFEATLNENSLIDGDLSELPERLAIFKLAGPNSISGNISSLNQNMFEFFLTGGSNTLLGDIQNLGPAMSIFSVEGVNTLSGNIEDLHQNFSKFSVNGQNTIGGDLGLLQDPSPSLVVGGLNTITFLNSSPTWEPAGRINIELSGDSTLGMTLNQTDGFLQYISDNVTGSNTPSLVRLDRMGDEGRSLNSDVAVGNLENLGFNVLINLMQTE